MKKIIVVTLVIASLLALAEISYSLLSKNSDQAPRQTTAETKTTTKETEQVSLNDLINRKTSLKCTYDVKDGESRNNGVAYFSGAKDMYGEFTNKSNEESLTAYVIRRGDTQYVWQKGSNEGYKADVSAFTKEKQQQMSEELDPDKRYEFSCENWEKNESKFQLPKDIRFNDLSVQMKQVHKALEQAKE